MHTAASDFFSKESVMVGEGSVEGEEVDGLPILWRLL